MKKYTIIYVSAFDTHRKMIFHHQSNGTQVIHYSRPKLEPKDKPPGTKPNLARYDEVLDSELREAQRNDQGIAPRRGTARHQAFNNSKPNLDNV